MAIDDKIIDLAPDYQARIYHTELLNVEFADPKTLFRGFNEMYAVTYSYNLKLLSTILEDYDHAEIILGSPAIAKSDQSMQQIIAEALAGADIAASGLADCENLKEMIRDGKARFSTPAGLTAHQKVYILRSYNGRTRVIYGSANASFKAWHDQGQTENYNYDDGALRYEEAFSDFEALQEMCTEIPYEAIEGKYDPKEGNPIITKVTDTDEVIVVQKGPIEPEVIRYCVNNEAAAKKYSDYIKGAKLQTEEDAVLINAGLIRHIERKRKQDEEKRSKEAYIPSLTYDIKTGTAYLDGTVHDLEPEPEDVKRDLSAIMDAFENLGSGDFIDSLGDLQETFFKLYCLIYVSPFHALLRNELHAYGNDGFYSMPLFAMITSATPNSGKSFMIKLAIKTMTGKPVDPLNGKDLNGGKLGDMILSTEGCPIFVDEIKGRFTSDKEDLLKDDNFCLGHPDMPMVVIAGNNIKDPAATFRKRVAFFKVGGSLKSSIDRNAYRAKGADIEKRAGNAFYRLYTKYLMEGIAEILKEIQDPPVGWYPDTVNLSSRVFLRILEEYGFEIPGYMRPLTWNKDYDCAASTQSAVKELQNEYEINRKAFSREGENIMIDLGTDEGAQRRGKNWETMLPNELQARYVSRRDGGTWLVIQNAGEFERLTGIRIKRKWFSR